MPTQKSRILIIDNEKEFTTLIRDFLEESCGFEVKVVPDGYNGLIAAAKLKPDLILLDVLMPAMNGFQILEKLKQSEETAPIPVIMVTAVEDDKSRQKAAQLHCEDYLTKPIKLEELKTRINKVLSK